MPRGYAITLLAVLSTMGVLLLLLALGFIIVSERRVDIAAIAQASRAIHIDDPSAPADQLVTISGALVADGAALGDDRFLKPGAYLQIERIVEMYARERYEDYKDSKGNSVYREREIWTRTTSGLGNVSNPPKALDDLTVTAKAAHIGTVGVDPQLAPSLPGRTRLTLQLDALPVPSAGQIKDGQLYTGNGTPQRPLIGDLRLTYYVVPSDQVVTVFAALDGTHMMPYHASDGRAIYQIIAGERAAALAELGGGELIGAWIVRIGATLAIWLGLLLLFYASRRMFAWPRALRLNTGSARLASSIGLPLAALAIGSLWISNGDMRAFAIAICCVLLGSAAAIWRNRSTQPVV